eukprot:scaffold267126_cov21-Tisochrysis_lutea.AAC.1
MASAVQPYWPYYSPAASIALSAYLTSPCLQPHSPAGSGSAACGHGGRPTSAPPVAPLHAVCTPSSFGKGIHTSSCGHPVGSGPCAGWPSGSPPRSVLQSAQKSLCSLIWPHASVLMAGMLWLARRPVIAAKPGDEDTTYCVEP